MAEEHILRLRRTDRGGEYVLVQVVATGGRPLDLNLVGSENEHVYPGRMRDATVNALQASNYSGNSEEWKTTLRYVLLHEQPPSPLPEILQGVEAVAAIESSTLTITLRKNISGIHQRLGAIRLAQNDNEEIDIFAWASTAAAAADGLREDNSFLRSGAGTQQEQVAKLERQLDDLIKAKKEHEAELLKKFAALLNAKKLKIRDQQRMLAGAKVDPKVTAAVGESRNGGGRGAATSRKGKRKAAIVEDEDVDDEVNGELDEDDLAREQETPQQTEDEVTEDEDELDATPPSSITVGRSAGSKGKALDAAREKDSSAKGVGESGSIPPRRELPFSKKSAPATKRAPAPAPAAEDDDEGETDDDEL